MPKKHIPKIKFYRNVNMIYQVINTEKVMKYKKKHVFYLSLFLKRKLHIKVIEVIPLIAFFFLCLPRSLSFIIHLFYFISFILSFILFQFIIKFKIFPPLFFFPPLSSLFLTFQEVDMTALQFAGPSFPLSPSYHPSSYFTF